VRCAPVIEDGGETANEVTPVGVRRVDRRLFIGRRGRRARPSRQGDDLAPMATRPISS
jgi:hypothetical protein